MYEKTHIDLFSGIGGFALAAQRVWPNIQHTFVEYDPFCQAVLKKHWPEAEVNGDIHAFIADTKERRREGREVSVRSSGSQQATTDAHRAYILTGGFPCQPFSAAGRRKGTEDDRYLWPAMFEAVTLFKPRWVIAENVAGLVTWNNGMVLETVCSDLEGQGYEVQPFIIPATAVGAPHRRDRVWIIGYAKYNGYATTEKREGGNTRSDSHKAGTEEFLESTRSDLPRHATTNGSSTGRITRAEPGKHDDREREVCEDVGNDGDKVRGVARERDSDSAHAERTGKGKRREFETARQRGKRGRAGRTERNDWQANWPEIAATLCRVDDGIPRRLDRNPRLKALGNAIVPQVAEMIMRGIQEADKKSPAPSAGQVAD